MGSRKVDTTIFRLSRQEDNWTEEYRRAQWVEIALFIMLIETQLPDGQMEKFY